ARANARQTPGAECITPVERPGAGLLFEPDPGFSGRTTSLSVRQTSAQKQSLSLAPEKPDQQLRTPPHSFTSENRFGKLHARRRPSQGRSHEHASRIGSAHSIPEHGSRSI